MNLVILWCITNEVRYCIVSSPPQQYNIENNYPMVTCHGFMALTAEEVGQLMGGN